VRTWLDSSLEKHPDELQSAIAEAFAVVRPAIVDCAVAADELPNIPHIELDLAKNYAIPKIKEAAIAVTGR
jgi:pyruvate dehydrogenase (quinone)